MEAVQTQAGEDLDGRGPQVLVIGKNAWSLGALGPILRAAMIGFVIGTIAMIVVAVFAT